MSDIPDMTKRLVIDFIAGHHCDFLNYATEHGVCYDTIDGAREVFWTERNKNELIIALRPGQDDEAQVTINFDPDDGFLQIINKIASFID